MAGRQCALGGVIVPCSIVCCIVAVCNVMLNEPRTGCMVPYMVAGESDGGMLFLYTHPPIHACIHVHVYMHDNPSLVSIVRGVSRSGTHINLFTTISLMYVESLQRWGKG